MTNYEKIKQMSVEEMAEMLNCIVPNIAIKLLEKYVARDTGHIVEWLDSEVEE